MTHTEYMDLALTLAEQGRYTVSPNPMVGCVIVRDQAIVGQGYHLKAGQHHAEINALAMAGPLAENATAYVTLEPCCHTGRTPPCVDALIRAKLKKIYVACLDPNPLMSGKTVAALRTAGIEVEVGILEEKAKQLNQIFFHYITQKKPYVIAKWAMSLDGKMTVNAEDSPIISGQSSHQHSHQLRRAVDAILIGANTARIDNPTLTARLFNHDSATDKQPLRIVLTSQGQLSPTLTLLTDAYKTLLVTTETIPQNRIKQWSAETVEILQIPYIRRPAACPRDPVNYATMPKKTGYVDLPHLLNELGARQLTSLLVEGGRTVLESFFAENLVNQIHVYLAPVIIGSAMKYTLPHMSFSALDQDCHLVSHCQQVAYV